MASTGCSAKGNLDYTDKLAGIIKEEYAYEKKEEIFT